MEARKIQPTRQKTASAQKNRFKIKLIDFFLNYQLNLRVTNEKASWMMDKLKNQLNDMPSRGFENDLIGDHTKFHSFDLNHADLHLQRHQHIQSLDLR